MVQFQSFLMFSLRLWSKASASKSSLIVSILHLSDTFQKSLLQQHKCFSHFTVSMRPGFSCCVLSLNTIERLLLNQHEHVSHPTVSNVHWVFGVVLVYQTRMEWASTFCYDQFEQYQISIESSDHCRPPMFNPLAHNVFTVHCIPFSTNHSTPTPRG